MKIINIFICIIIFILAILTFTIFSEIMSKKTHDINNIKIIKGIVEVNR